MLCKFLKSSQGIRILKGVRGAGSAVERLTRDPYSERHAQRRGGARVKGKFTPKDFDRYEDTACLWTDARGNNRALTIPAAMIYNVI